MNILKQNKLKLASILILLFCLNTFFKLKEKDKIIQSLQNEILLLKKNSKNDFSNDKIKWSADSYNYLAIGNSITYHGLCSYWWNAVGMAASDIDHDYVHLTIKHLKEKRDDVNSYIYNFNAWERQCEDRDETLESIEPYLDKALNLVTIQLGENTKELKTFKNDFISLINFIKNKAPNAEIVVIGDFWKYKNRDSLKQRAASECNVRFANLDKIADNRDYFCGMKTKVYDALGNKHIVKHHGTSVHPGDKGMEFIAKKIISELEKSQ